MRIPRPVSLHTLLAVALLSPLALTAAASAAGVNAEQESSYLLIGVSGTLQDGFALRDRLDYTTSNVDGSGGEHDVPAIFIGRALVRGYKAYLDIKDPGWREFREQDPPQVPNAVVMPTGCRKHANVYWIYAVDHRQYLHILAGEPRFLSITPDTGMIDLNAEETDDQVRKLALHEIQKQGKRDESVVAIPLVTGVWFHSSYVESPMVQEKGDGTQITSYDASLAAWANVERDDLVVAQGRNSVASESRDCQSADAANRSEMAWEGVFQAIRDVMANPYETSRPESLECRERVRFGVGKDQCRVNYPFSTTELLTVLGRSSVLEV